MFLSRFQPTLQVPLLCVYAIECMYEQTESKSRDSGQMVCVFSYCQTRRKGLTTTSPSEGGPRQSWKKWVATAAKAFQPQTINFLKEQGCQDTKNYK